MERPVRRPTAAARLLALLHAEGPMSRAAATARLGLTRTSVGQAAAWLTEVGVLRTTADEASSGRGRPSPLLTPDPGGPVVVAAHLRPGRVDIAVLGLGAAVLDQRWYPLPKPSTPEKVLPSLAIRINSAIGRVGRPCVGVAVGLAGMTRGNGIVRNALHFDWDGVPAGEMLAERVDGKPPVHIENDSALTALAEYRRGAGRQASTLLVLACEHIGIGGALLGDGVALPGTGHALEAGHLSIDPTGLLCACGQRGCLEMYADGRALLRGIGTEAIDDPAPVAALLTAAEAGEKAAADSVTAVAERLGIGLSSLVNLLGPDRVVLAGLLGELYRLRGPVIRELLMNSVVARTDETSVSIGQVAEAVLVGAGELAFEDLLRHPLYVLEENPA